MVNGEPVGEPFKEKVLAAIARLGYKYNSSGRVLRTDETNTVAVIMPNTENPFFGELVHHICMALGKRNRRMLLCLTENDRDRETEMIQMAQQNGVDGIISLTYNPDLTVPDNIPLVTIDRFFSVSVPCIAADNFGGGVLAAQKLRELGCTRVAFLRAASELPTEPKKRKDGFVSACVEMELVDAEGRVVPDAEIRLRAEVTGQGWLAGFGTANPMTAEDYTDGETVSWRGRALAETRRTPGCMRTART